MPIEKRRRIFVTKSTTLILSLLLCGFGLTSQARATTLSVFGPDGSSTNFSVSAESEFQVGVYADSYTDLYAWQFDLSWNPAVLSLDGITEGNALQAAGTTYFLTGSIDNVAGVAAATADTLIGSIPGATGTDVSLAYFTFTALNPGTSSLDLANVILLDSNLNIILSATVSGTATVPGSSPPPPTTVPEPSFVLVVGAGIVLVFALARFRPEKAR